MGKAALRIASEGYSAGGFSRLLALLTGESMGISEAKSITFTSSQSEPAAKPLEIRILPVLDSPASIEVEPAAKAKRKSRSKAKVRAKTKAKAKAKKAKKR